MRPAHNQHCIIIIRPRHVYARKARANKLLNSIGTGIINAAESAHQAAYNKFQSCVENSPYPPFLT